MLKRKYLLPLLLLLTTSLSSVAFAQEEDPAETRARRFLTLILGIEHDEKIPPIPKKIKAGGDCKNSGIVEVSISDDMKTLRFTPRKEGNCVYTLKDSGNGKVVAEFGVTIRKSKLDAILHDMQDLLGDIEGINLKVVNNRVTVDGQVMLPRDMARISKVVAQFGEQASSIVTMSPLAQKKIAEYIARDINNPEIEVRAVNDKFILQGVAANEDEKMRAEIIAKTYIPPEYVDPNMPDFKIRKPANDGVINLITVKQAAPPPPGKMIQLVVHYVELAKNYSKGFNFQFGPSLKDESGARFSLGSGAKSVTSEVTGIISNFIPKLNWAKSHGHARVLESTSMIVLDGKQGTLDSSSDYPYQVVTEKGTGISFKKVGIVSQITPTIVGERSDTINLAISFKIDALINATGSAPITSTNSVNTEIIVRSGQSAAIGGLIKSGNFVNYNNPDAGPKNAIISLYASKDFTRNQTQFVVFVTPIIKSSASAGSEKIKKKFRLRD